MKLMTHVVIGYPSLEATEKIVKLMVKSGVDLIELQIPFSDPLADGPTIMRACEKSLENGTKVKDAFIVMKKLSSQISIPLLFMAYYNTVFKYGVENFVEMQKIWRLWTNRSLICQLTKKMKSTFMLHVKISAA